MNIRLGLYETIDKHFDEWLSYDNVLKLYFITSDIEIYGKERYKKSIYRAGSISTNNLNELLKSFNAVSNTDKESLKNIYIDFIEEMCKPDKKIAPIQNGEKEEERTENYTVADEYDLYNEQKQDTTEQNEESLDLDEKTKSLERLILLSNISDVERFALEFLKSDRKEKNHLLNNFTLNGITQIANRGAYKLYYLNRVNLSTK